MASCASLRDGPLATGDGSMDAGMAVDAADEASSGGATADAPAELGPEHDREWAMWPLPPSTLAPGNYAVSGRLVRDETTRLEWVRSDGAMAWVDAAGACASETLDGGGFRLPTRIELLSLVDYAPRGSGIVEAVFGEGAAVEAWSATPDALALNTRAWSVRFETGESETDERTVTKAVLCVRVGAGAREHYAFDDGIVRDVRTRLEWTRAPQAPAPVTFADALLVCNNLSLSGGQWRVPSARELESLVDVRASSAPAWDRAAFGEGVPGDPVFWTLTASRGPAPTRRIAVDFRATRSVHAREEAELAFVRCVRGPR